MNFRMNHGTFLRIHVGDIHTQSLKEREKKKVAISLRVRTHSITEVFSSMFNTKGQTFVMLSQKMLGINRFRHKQA